MYMLIAIPFHAKLPIFVEFNREHMQLDLQRFFYTIWKIMGWSQSVKNQLSRSTTAMLFEGSLRASFRVWRSDANISLFVLLASWVRLPLSSNRLQI